MNYEDMPWWLWVVVSAVAIALIVWGFLSWNKLKQRNGEKDQKTKIAFGFAVAGIFFPLLELVPIILNYAS